MNSVLIACETSTIGDLLEKIFSNMFFKTYLVDNGEDALKSFRENKQPIVVLDYNLPIIDGTDVLYTIKSMENIEQPKIMFCSTINNVETIKKAISSGCDDYIMQPFDEEIIVSKLRILGVI